jgi:hypothetical protein
LRLGGRLPVHVSYGLHHFAQWGGTNYDPYGELPNDWNAFISIFKGGGGYKPDPNVPWTEWANRVGNHLGSRNFGAEIEFSKYKLSLYWQNIFEDGSGKAYRNIKDGLFGISLRSNDRNKTIYGLVYEFFNSTDQSGKLNSTDSIKPDGHNYELGGNDDYLNSGVYIKGWTYMDLTIGSPFFTSPEILKGNHSDYIRNNRIISHHFGIEGRVEKIDFKVLYSFSINYGTYSYPLSFRRIQHLLYVKANWDNIVSNRIKIATIFATDIGTFYGNNFGILIPITFEF